MSGLRLQGFEENLRESYQRFAQLYFGGNSYQGNGAYIDWLYSEHPIATDMENNFIVGLTEDGQVVGCIHKMQLLWNTGEAIELVPAVHNLMVADEHRKGLGAFLILTAFKNERHALIPGVDHSLSVVYSKLGCENVNAAWFRRVLRPFRGGIKLGLDRCLKYQCQPRFFENDDVHSIHKEKNIFVTMNPEGDLLRQVVNDLNESRSYCGPVWDEELLRWRCFHEKGPRHILVYSLSSSKIKDFLIVSLGPRHSLNTARVVGAGFSSEKIFLGLVDYIEKLLRKIGVDVLLTFCADSVLQKIFETLAWKKIQNPPRTFIFHKNQKEVFSNMTFTGIAGDFGLEAIV